ncbi:MAG TPA: DUF2231 domain-containing protein [Pyrinomonadaceae bacterium]|nr:DUF2231 domain-containing protein [Pyrinomonadaceae bacterium]
MESRAKALGHPIHQMLIPFPFGLLATAVIFDIIYLLTSDAARASTMATVAYYMIAAGIIGGLIAAPFGAIDYMAIPKNTRARAVGAWHGIGNVFVLLLFAGSWLMRRDEPTRPETLELVLSFAGFALAGLTGWLGGELVDRLGVGVDEGAHLDAPNSLTGRPASERATGAGKVI